MFLTTTKDLRNLNKGRVIEILRSCGVMTKNQIARALNLSFSTVSSICNELVEDGFLYYAAGNITSGGRLPELLGLNVRSKFSLCIDLTSRTHVGVALAGLDNTLILQKKLPFPAIENVQSILSACVNVYPNLLQEASVSNEQVLGIGIVVPGIYDHQRKCVVNSTFTFLEGSPLEDLANRMFNLPTYIGNDANLAALASSMNGGHQEYKEVLFIYVGEGLGLGIVHKGEIFTGARGFAGEIAHIPIGDPEFVCWCGNRGCIEGILSSSGIQREFSKVRVDENEVSKRALGETKAKLGHITGILVSVLVNLFDPEIVFIGGDQEPMLLEMLPYIRQEIIRRVVLQQTRDIQVCIIPAVHDLFMRGVSEALIQQWLVSLALDTNRRRLG